MRITKNHFLLVLAICILAMMLVATYFVFFFNKTAIEGGNIEKISELMKIDFTDVEIIDIKLEHSEDGILNDCTKIIVFLRESGEWESKEYFTDCEEWFDTNPEYMLSAEIAKLKEVGIELHQIQKRGVNFNQVKVGFSIGEFGIYWYQIDESYDGKSNVVLFANIPRKISMNIDKINQTKAD